MHRGYLMVKNELVPIYEDITKHLLNDGRPSIFLNNLILGHNLKYPFTMLKKLKLTEQSPKHHPEGNVWNHTILVVDEAAKMKDKSKDSKVFMWAALLHDIGKPDTTKKRKGKITSYDHDRVGVKLTREFLRNLTEDADFIKSVEELVRWHMHIIYVLNKLPYGNVDTMIKEGDIDEIALLGWCDRMGRTDADADEEHKNIEKFKKICYEKRRNYQSNNIIQGQNNSVS